MARALERRRCPGARLRGTRAAWPVPRCGRRGGLGLRLVRWLRAGHEQRAGRQEPVLCRSVLAAAEKRTAAFDAASDSAPVAGHASGLDARWPGRAVGTRRLPGTARLLEPLPD